MNLSVDLSKYDIKRGLFVIQGMVRNIEHFLYTKFDYDEEVDYAKDDDMRGFKVM